MRTLTPSRGRRSAFADHYARQLAVADYARLWREACDYSGLCRRVRVPAGQTVVTPDLVDAAGADPLVLVVRLLPGMLAADIRAQAPRLANALGGARLTVAPRGTEHARLELHRVDPLADPYGLAHAELDGFLGVGEDSRDVAIPWALRVHTLVQGSTGYGKSTLTYGQLAPLASRTDVAVCGIDPSGLLWRPWDRHPDPWTHGAHAGDLVSGLGDDLEPHVDLLRRLAAGLDERLDLLPLGVDNLVPSPAVPLRVILLEELSGFLRTVDADRKLAAVVRPLLGRLFAEGRKVGYRCLAVIPRADATVLGPGIRDQCGLKVSFAVEPEGFRMAHPTTAGIDPDEHLAASPGIAAVTAPRLGTFRLRVGDLPYGEYCARVAAALEQRAEQGGRA